MNRENMRTDEAVAFSQAPLFDFAGRTALVTGGGYGIGRAIALALASQGARVVILGRSAGRLAETLRDLGPEGQAIEGDLASDKIYDRIEDLDGIDIVVHNAGGNPYSKPWPQQSPQNWRATYEINVIAAYRLAAALVPPMTARGWGRYINIASIYGHIGEDSRMTSPHKGHGAYVAAKHAVIGFTRYLAAQVSHAGVTVNSVSPGFISWKPTTSPESHESRALKANRTPAGRNGQCEDVAGAVVYLASDAASFTTGADIRVDGGWSAW